MKRYLGTVLLTAAMAASGTEMNIREDAIFHKLLQ